MIPPPPPPRAHRNDAPPPPPPPLPNQGSTTQTSFATTHPAAPNAYGYSGPKSYEPYGEIHATPSSNAGVAHRRKNEAQSEVTSSDYTYGGGSTSSYAVPPNSYVYGKTKGSPQQERPVTSSPANAQYLHNSSSLFFLVPTLTSILWWHESPITIQIFLFVALVLYGLDLINARDGLAVALWVSALVLTMASGFGILLQVDDSDASGGAMILFLLRLSVEGMLFCSLACWGTLQCRWLYTDVPSIATGMEKSLHALLPPVSSSILSYHIVRLLMGYWGVDRVATFSPHLFSLLMALGMISVGCSVSSFKGDMAPTPAFAISSLCARIHSMLLLMVPGVMHCLIFRHRIFGRHASFDELNDLVLVWAVPYLLHCGVLVLAQKSPYEMRNEMFPKTGQNTLRGTLIPMIVSLLSSLAAQQRYLIPLCNAVSYQFNGHDLPSTLVVSIYLTGATLCSLSAMWIWGRKSGSTNELLFGEYHEDVVQLTVSASGLLLGKAFGIPWNLTPLPILAFLGLSVWITTRMLRYLSIFLFVVHAAGVVLFSYRFASIDMQIPLALPGVEVGLIRFGMIEVIASVLMGLVVGFAVRPPGGVGAALLKRVDVAGLLFIAYCLLLTTLELTLLKRPVPQDVVGKESDIGIEDDEFLYDHATALITSALAIGVTVLSQRFKIISAKSAILTMAIAVGKAIAIIIDANELDGKVRSGTKREQISERLFYRAITAAILLVMILAPRATLTPIHIKSTTRYKRSLSDGKPLGSIPTRTYRIITAYALVILPVTLVGTIPMVITPLVMALSAHYGGGAYYNIAPPLSEMAGVALFLWGIACLSMLNHYLPDGGAETWKKASALTLLMGVGIAFSAPTVPEWIAGDNGMGVSNPYASISSLGTRLASQGRSRTGGWGILSAALATLLAVSGPLELRERRHPSGRKDQLLLVRLMIFSVLFGSGVAWFITVTNMSQESFAVLLVTALSCIVVSFFGTVTCVLGYFLELENFNEVDQMAKVWGGGFVIFSLITGTPSLFTSSLSMHAFGAGGWLSTYLSVSCCVTFALSLVLRMRPSKNQVSRGLGNLSCILSYFFAMLCLYGRYGVAGLDQAFDVTTIIGLPASVFGTYLLSPMLLALEGEVSNERRSRVSRISGTNGKPPGTAIGLILKNLSASNRFAPLVMGTLLVFFTATLYSILLRGSFFFGGTVAKSHLDVFSKVIGKKTDTLAMMAQSSVSHSQALVVSARLAGSSFWTSDSIFGPLLHLGGLAAALPSALLLCSQMWSGSNASKSQLIIALPLNAIPVLLCRGVPCLLAAALVGAIGGTFQLLNLHRSDRRSRMRI